MTEKDAIIRLANRLIDALLMCDDDLFVDMVANSVHTGDNIPEEEDW